MDGKAITGLPSHKVARHGLVRTFQNVRLFKQLTVLENLLVAQHTQVEARLLPGLLKLKSYRQSEADALARAAQWLDFMGLREFANREAGNLAYGHQRRLEIARCMITKPRLLMLDEPAAGLNPQEKRDLQSLIDQLRREFGVAVLLIEHDMSLIMGISDRILVMEHGKPITTGTPSRCATTSASSRRTWGGINAEAGKHTHLLRRHPGAEWRVGGCQQGRDRHPDRRQRRRQDHAAHDRLRQSQGQGRQDHVRGRGHHPQDTHHIMRNGIAISPEGRRVFRT